MAENPNHNQSARLTAAFKSNLAGDLPCRPPRGSPEQTRKRLVTAAARLFNRVGYHETDSNRITWEAGYSTGTFYKHFKDKREAFLVAYETWVAS